VEHNELNQEVASELLCDAGLIVDLAHNGQIALNKVRAANYDIVLMDMQMPVMDGLTATREIRKDARFRDLPVVAMTANAMQGDRERCMAAGMNDHVAKPIEPENLWKMLLKWIKPRYAGVADAATSVSSPAPLAVDLPTDVEGLDVADGLRRMLGKRGLYLSMLRKFVIGQKLATANIVEALRGELWSAAERRAHTLKGVAGTIGAVDLPRHAQRLEAAIKERRPREEIDARLGDLERPLGRLIAQLERQLPPEPEAMAVERSRFAAEAQAGGVTRGASRQRRAAVVPAS
jgi:CheY-like chemotaxis protein